jgi:hypothetical protein
MVRLMTTYRTDEAPFPATEMRKIRTHLGPRTVTWIKPDRVVATIEFSELSDDQIPRFPSMKGIRLQQPEADHPPLEQEPNVTDPFDPTQHPTPPAYVQPPVAPQPPVPWTLHAAPSPASAPKGRLTKVAIGTALVVGLLVVYSAGAASEDDPRAAGANPTATPVVAVVAATAAPTIKAAAATATPRPTTRPTNRPTPEPTPEPRDYDAEFATAIVDDDCVTLTSLVGEMPSADEEWPVTGETVTAMGTALTACLDGGSTVAKLVPRGTAARAEDWQVKVTGKVNFDAWKVIKRENMFNDPAPKGWKMVIIPVSFTNRGDAKANLLGLGEYVYGQGTLIERTDFDDPTCGVIPKDVDFFTDVRPGGTLKGNMCFVVEASDIKTLRFAVPQGMFSDSPDVEFALR